MSAYKIRYTLHFLFCNKNGLSYDCSNDFISYTYCFGFLFKKFHLGSNSSIVPLDFYKNDMKAW